MRSFLLACSTCLALGGCNNTPAVMPPPPDMASLPSSGGGDMATAGGDDMATFDTGPAQQVATGGVLQAVSADQTLMAYLTSAAPSNGVVAGSLALAQLPPSGQPLPIGDNAWAASFGSSSTVLTYLTGPTPSVDHGSTAVYGALNLWTSGSSAGVRLSTGFAPLRTTTPNNSWALFWDTAAASVAGPGDVKLVRSAECTAGGCTAVTVAPAATGVINIAPSPDGAHAAYVIKNAGATATFDVFLVTVATGAAARVITAGSSPSIAFSTDGALFAAVGPAGALTIVTSATGAAATWAALPTGSKTVQVAFADTATLLVRATPTGATSPTAYKTTATAATALATGIVGMELSRSAAKGVARFVVLNTSVTAGVGDMTAYDLTANAPAGVPLASMASAASLAVSFDQSYARVLESYDNSSQTGTLTLVSLSDGTKTTLATGVSLSSLAFVNAHSLFYIDSTQTLTSWSDGTMTTYASGADAYRVRYSPTNIYFDVGPGGDDVFGYAPGIYTQPLQ
jgi:hypothetical protein